MRRIVFAGVVALVAVLAASPAGAGPGDQIAARGNDNHNGPNPTATATSIIPGNLGDGGDDGSGNGGGGDGPLCWYSPLMYTTQDEQRTDIRPEETRPGSWGWLDCDDGTHEFQFFLDEEPVPQVDPRVLADSVEINPGVPELRTSPPRGSDHLVNIESFFWVDSADWVEVSETATAGAVSVTVTATPRTLIVDPGDGSPALECAAGGTPFVEGVAAEAQASDCSHVYEASGVYAASVTVVYDVAWTSNTGPAGVFDSLTPGATAVEIPVSEAQAIVTG